MVFRFPVCLSGESYKFKALETAFLKLMAGSVDLYSDQFCSMPMPFVEY